MTWPATSPGAAVRVLRIAAGRRALRLALVVGGLLALGFLCGERAYAADGVSAGASSASGKSITSAASATSAASDTAAKASGVLRSSAEGTVERLLSPPAQPGAQGESAGPSAKPAVPPNHEDRAPQPEAPQDPAPQPQDPQPNGGRLLDPVTDHGTQPIRTHVVRPVGDVVRTVTEGLAEGLAEVRAKVPPLASLPVLPTAPESPGDWPSWPGFELPVLPGFPDFPGAEVPALPGHTLPAPVTGTPQPGPDLPGSGDEPAATGRTGKETALAHGPHFIADATASHTPALGGAHRTAPSGSAPAYQAPSENPGGVLGNHAAGDNGGPRHGDAHAVSLSRRVALGLVPGAPARVEADEIKDRHRDIPVSPA
ncbi:hypothetical protein IM697_40060 [Streptomyces ferrugineus]|uniref:Uncharacterized protein n=1 Tax=Streptomyces ferrugineus TaxID=1413221 RepID=A0A7M2SIH8_9ACTN|nr:hypothetical protein [Streptomyces ferrugineus]QOV36146.1 hypothetical protein IM697_40060 [Streptomyces ferrugineus]